MITAATVEGLRKIRLAIEGLQPAEHGGAKHHPLAKNLEAALTFVGVSDVRGIDGTIPVISDYAPHQRELELCIGILRSYYRRVDTEPHFMLD